MNKIPVGILGASGYAGRELCHLVASHPCLELAFATAQEQRGTAIRVGRDELRLVAAEDAPLSQARLIFSALPHGVSAQWIDQATAAGALAVDLSADLRPGAPMTGSHSGTAVPYGLPELNRATLKKATVVANPGCYPTAILLALAPLAQQGLIADGATIVVNAASGVTGAGNAPRRENLFAEVAEDYRAYGIGNDHRHLLEIRETVRGWGVDVDVIFTPHLLPVARGILASITVPVRGALARPLDIWRDAYADEPFIEVSEESPALRDVVRRNVVCLHARMCAHTRHPMVFVAAAIDNLLKGASGQALQNANLMLGLPETMGLPA